MSDNPSPAPLDYEALSGALARAGTIVDLAEAHGGVCGSLCSGGPSAADRWLAESIHDQDLSPEAAEQFAAALQLVAQESWRMLSVGELAFAPLVPPDDAPLEEQVQALALWCHGFLGAVGTAAGNDGEIEEILGDFAEISRAGLSPEEAAGQGQPDFALAELHEYVRVGVQLVFEALSARRAAGVDVH